MDAHDYKSLYECEGYYLQRFNFGKIKACREINNLANSCLQFQAGKKPREKKATTTIKAAPPKKETKAQKYDGGNYRTTKPVTKDWLDDIIEVHLPETEKEKEKLNIAKTEYSENKFDFDDIFE